MARRPRITPEILLAAYAQGVFPMAESKGSPEILWVDPRMRGVFPMDRFRISRSLRRRIRARPFDITVDRDFSGVVAGCADREETWINAEIVRLYEALHRSGCAHSIEVSEDGALVGGVYGVAIGAAFFGESMFSRRPDASKIALAYLIDRLRQGAFHLFDTQFLTPHLASLGAVEVPRALYHAQLAKAVAAHGRFDAAGGVPEPDQLLQRSTQMS